MAQAFFVVSGCLCSLGTCSNPGKGGIAAVWPRAMHSTEYGFDTGIDAGSLTLRLGTFVLSCS